LASLRRDPTPNYLLARGDIQRVEQLKGRQIGISRFGTASDFLLRSILRQLGLDPEKDVVIRQLGGDQAVRIAALQSGNIDGTLLNIDGKIIAEQLNFKVLYDARRLGIEFLSNDVVSRRGFVQAEGQLLRRFLGAVVEGVRYYKTHKSESVEIMAKYMANRNRKLLEIGYDYSAEMYERKPYPSTQGIQLALELIGHRNPKARGAQAELFVEPRFVKQLDDSGFIAGLYR
jgi:NitT/TauT family transport system substrate-binding protein